MNSSAISTLSPIPIPSPDPMRLFRQKRDRERRTVRSKYNILGFISSGTYGLVFKAQSLEQNEGGPGGLYAIKKFKAEKEGEAVTYTGISQSACREIALNREIDNINMIRLREVILEDRSIYMVFEYAEHDFLQIIYHHQSVLRVPIPVPVVKSLLYQLFNGVHYLHNQHILHRDLKPANILVTSNGVVKIGDLGLARLAHSPLQPLYVGDKVVVTIWYRAPELLLGAKHYTNSVDNWAVGCIFAELLSLRPIFRGEDAKMDNKKVVPFQKDQLTKIVEILGTPDEQVWPDLLYMPEYQNFLRLDKFRSTFRSWFQSRMNSPQAFDLICCLFEWDCKKRLSAKGALEHPWFYEAPLPTINAFSSWKTPQVYPTRRVTVTEDGGTALIAPAAVVPPPPMAAPPAPPPIPGSMPLPSRPPTGMPPSAPPSAAVSGLAAASLPDFIMQGIGSNLTVAPGMGMNMAGNGMPLGISTMGLGGFPPNYGVPAGLGPGGSYSYQPPHHIQYSLSGMPMAPQQQQHLMRSGVSIPYGIQTLPPRPPMPSSSASFGPPVGMNNMNPNLDYAQGQDPNGSRKRPRLK